jgi:2-polyprenyl-6-methoxyphenol hydroxylase-like FAD-dependent oxidoreductase
MIGDGAHAVTPQAGQGAAMALEDAETLAYTMSMERFPTDYRKYLTAWEGHRIERVERIKAFTSRNGRLRSPDPYFVQMAKEWVMWAVMKFSGPRLGLGWLYEYSGEDIVSILEGKQPRRF